MTADDTVNELLGILRRLHRENKSQMDEGVLRELVSLVIQYPLEGDRKACQDKMLALISTRVGGSTDAH
jgi:hypothetical protein